MSMITLQVAEEGRIVIPAEIRQKMGIRVGDHIALSWSDGSPELHIATRQQRLQHAFELVKQHTKTVARGSPIAL